MTTCSDDLLRPAQEVTPIDVDETVPLLFDYTDMAAGMTPASTPVITCEAISGTDADASSRLDGAPEVTSLQVVQWLTGCLRDAQYLVRCKWTMTNGYAPVQVISVRCLRVGGGA